ncbi:MAG: SIS domain-containing protein [Thermoleophilia bacterium]|nr:SIS domain-containing protein [Thermoleophilia bacterium]
MTDRADTGLWSDMLLTPETVSATVLQADGFDDVATLLTAPGVRRVIVTGNGAQWHVALAMWLAWLQISEPPVEVLAVPGGLVARGGFPWRDGDRLLALSSSGEFRDVIEAIASGAPRPIAAITANAESTIGRAADAHALVRVETLRARTHTQGYAGSLAAGLSVLARMADDSGLRTALNDVGERLAPLVERAAATPRDAGPRPHAGVCVGTGSAWPAALHAALCLREVAILPVDGYETREGATTGRFSVVPGDLAVTIAGPRPDPLMHEATSILTDAGARVVAVAGDAHADASLAPILALPQVIALAIDLAQMADLDADAPAWADAYDRTSRGPSR